MTARRLVELDKARRRREIATTAVSVVLSWAVLLAVYYLVSFKGHAAWTVAGILLVGGIVFGISLSRQFRKVIVADLPELRAIQALGVTVVLFLVLFASAYLALSADSADAFSRPLSHTGALYFVITVFSTVGFGDITPETDYARIVVSAQMLLDLVLLAVIVRTFVTAARVGLTGRKPPDDADTLTTSDPAATNPD